MLEKIEILSTDVVEKINHKYYINKKHVNSNTKVFYTCKICKKHQTNSLKQYKENLCTACLISFKLKNRSEEEKCRTVSKRTKTCLEKHGYEYAFHLEKSNETKFYRYGNRYYSNREKAENTTLEKYGFENVFSSIEVRDKIRINNLKRYGVENVFSSEEIKEKIKSTNLEKYDIEYPQKLEETKEKTRRTCLKRYNRQYGLNIEKSVQKQRLNFYSNILERVKFLVSPIFNLEDYKGQDFKYVWRCNTCGNIFEDKLSDGRIPRCYKCFPRLTEYSKSEKELVYKLKLLNLEIEENTRDVISPLELDIYIPSHNLAIEFNGTYWHSTIHKNKWDHQYKVELCRRLGIRLIHIYEWEWLENQKSCLDKIISYLDSSEEIKIRKPRPRFIQNNKERKYSELNLEKTYYTIWD